MVTRVTSQSDASRFWNLGNSPFVVGVFALATQRWLIGRNNPATLVTQAEATQDDRYRTDSLNLWRAPWGWGMAGTLSHFAGGVSAVQGDITGAGYVQNRMRSLRHFQHSSGRGRLDYRLRAAR
jgi:hypothetical protein